ncbi:MAG: hypothetical protein IPM08_10735 [Actinomycetales bacterium]|nr:hypothetical protein [Actinomycetales bacterium]
MTEPTPAERPEVPAPAHGPTESPPGAVASVAAPPVTSWRAFAEWSLVGIGSMWASWTILGYGWVIALITGGYAVKLALAHTPGPASWGFVAGLGLVPIYVGWANRAHTESMTALIWGASGTLTVGVAVLAFLWTRRRGAPVD